MVQAEKENCITPAPGVDAAYDSALAQMQGIRGELDDYLATQREVLRCATVCFWGT